jgi:hypothetical protein
MVRAMQGGQRESSLLAPQAALARGHWAARCNDIASVTPRCLNGIVVAQVAALRRARGDFATRVRRSRQAVGLRSCSFQPTSSLHAVRGHSSVASNAWRRPASGTRHFADRASLPVILADACARPPLSQRATPRPCCFFLGCESLDRRRQRVGGAGMLTGRFRRRWWSERGAGAKISNVRLSGGTAWVATILGIGLSESQYAGADHARP